jgi:hypothetical protein
MTSIHFVCRDRANLTAIKHPVYESGHWDLTLEQAESLVGGMVYLHQTKALLSYFGGRIDSYRPVDRGNAHSGRIAFTFTSTLACKGVKWRGAGHSRAWTSGVIEDVEGQVREP